MLSNDGTKQHCNTQTRCGATVRMPCSSSTAGPGAAGHRAHWPTRQLGAPLLPPESSRCQSLWDRDVAVLPSDLLGREHHVKPQTHTHYFSTAFCLTCLSWNKFLSIWACKAINALILDVSMQSHKHINSLCHNTTGSTKTNIMVLWRFVWPRFVFAFPETNFDRVSMQSHKRINSRCEHAKP
jgi:hypothetical protein